MFGVYYKSEKVTLYKDDCLVVLADLPGCSIDMAFANPGIVFIMIPIRSPVVPALGFDPLWFAVTVCINLQMSFMSPSSAMAICIVLGVAPKDLQVSTADVIRGVFPFMGLVMIGLVLCAICPGLILWLPGQMIE